MGTLPSGGRSANAATVAARSDPGPREVNEDRSFTALSAEDQSWVIAVADGLSGHPRGADAAEAAVAALPSRIASLHDMETVFVAAHRAVAALAPSPTTWRDAMKLCPMTTLCVAAWSAESGLIIAHMGNTLPVLLGWDQEVADGYVSGRAHHGAAGWLTSCLGIDAPRTSRERVGAAFWCETKGHLAGEWAAVVLSNGASRKLHPVDECIPWWSTEEIAHWVGEIAGPVGGPAERIAAEVLAAARDRGLDDNATVAVAHMAAESIPRMVQRPGTEDLGFSEEGSRIVAELTRGPELALFLQQLDREDAARELGIALD